MTDSFDPYHKWLGIPPKDQPPNHYRLLGIELFEEDQDVIDSAANQRMSYLQDLASGPRMAASQKLMNEVAQARVVLLDANKRSSYDHQLRDEMVIFDPTSFSVAEPSPPPEPSKRSDDSGEVAPPASKGLKPQYLLIGSSLISLILVGSIAAVLMRASTTPQVEGSLLVIEWPLNEREGAAIWIDGKKQTLPSETRIEIKVEQGRHRLRFERDGYRSIISQKNFGAKPVKLKLGWRLEASD